MAAYLNGLSIFSSENDGWRPEYVIGYQYGESVMAAAVGDDAWMLCAKTRPTMAIRNTKAVTVRACTARKEGKGK